MRRLRVSTTNKNKTGVKSGNMGKFSLGTVGFNLCEVYTQYTHYHYYYFQYVSMGTCMSFEPFWMQLGKTMDSPGC